VDTPAKFFNDKEMKAAIRDLNPNKLPGYDLIINQICRSCQRQE